ncbi:MAG TPA: D-2-hydroxyacid dehydrogenase [Ancylobacter sp.]
MAKLRLHIQEDEGHDEIYRITPAAYARESVRFADVADRLDVSFGANNADDDIGLSTAEVLLCGYFNNKGLQTRAPKLRWVQSIFAGVEKLVPAIAPGVTLTNSSGIHAQKAGEYALGAILMLNSAVPHFIEAQRARAWSQRFTPSVSRRTVVILGAGRLAAAVARNARLLGMGVIGVARTAGPRPDMPDCRGIDELRDVLPKADFLVLMVPNTPETRGLIGRHELGLLPAHAGIVNLGRGSVMDHEALVDRLEAGELSGAFLDVFEQEPLPENSRLWTAPRLIISPHCALDDGPDYVRLSLDLFFANMRRYLDGEALDNVVDTGRGY